MQKILKQNKEKACQIEENFKIGASLSALPLIPSLSAGKTVKASKVSLGLVKNGEVITAAHWGILKLAIKDGKIVKSEPWGKSYKNG